MVGSRAFLFGFKIIDDASTSKGFTAPSRHSFLMKNPPSHKRKPHSHLESPVDASGDIAGKSERLARTHRRGDPPPPLKFGGFGGNGRNSRNRDARALLAWHGWVVQ